MKLPDFIDALPRIDLPFPDEIVETRVIRSDTALAVFFIVHETLHLPEHSHKGQWGTVIEGQLDLTMAGETRTYGPGDSYDIPSGTPHSAVVQSGSIIFDLFEEPDRYPLRA